MVELPPSAEVTSIVKAPGLMPALSSGVGVMVPPAPVGRVTVLPDDPNVAVAPSTDEVVWKVTMMPTKGPKPSVTVAVTDGL